MIALRNNLIAEIKGLDNLPNLEELELYDNRIVQIKGLDNLPNLTILDLSYNNIKKIENIDKLPKLKKLFLLSNKIKKVRYNLHRYKIFSLKICSFSSWVQTKFDKYKTCKNCQI